MKKFALILVGIIALTSVASANLITAPVTPTMPTLSLEQKEKRVAQQIRGISNQQTQADIRAFQQVYKLVWENPDEDLTPQVVCNALGVPDCAQMFQAAAMRAQEINTFLPNTLPATAPKPVQIHVDGSVYIGE